MNKKGFTLVEVLVAVFVISIALGGAFTAAQLSLRYSIASQNRVVAFYLAQEGFELIKNVRDNNFQDNTTHWLYALDGGGSEEEVADCINNDCRISAFPKGRSTNTVRECEPSDDSCLLRKNFGGEIWHDIDASGNTALPFKRYFRITNTDKDEIRVDMTIAWTQGSEDYTFKTVEYISNWRGDLTLD